MDAADPLADALAVVADAPGEPLTATEVADRLDCTRRTAYNRLERLADRGAIETKKVGARGRVWWQPPGATGDGGADSLAALGDAARRLLGAEREAEVSELLADAATDLLDAPAVVYGRDADRDALVPRERSGERGFVRRAFPELSGSELPAGERLRYHADVTADPSLDVAREDADLRAALFVRAGDDRVLVAGTPEVGGFDGDARRSVETLAASAAAAYDRVERERRLARQRERLAALDELNGVVREITEALVRQSTREEVERVVCDRLAAADSYRFAWIGEVEPKTDRVVLREEAGVEGYLDDVEVSVDPDDPAGRGPTGRAARTREIQVTHHVDRDERYEPWRDHADEYGFRSSAAIPIVHEGTLYGVLNVYAPRPRAFEGEELTVVGQLGEVVGHAIASIERKRALMGDEVVELEFRIRDVFDRVGVAPTDGRISFDRTVPLGDDEYLEYGTATDDAMATLESLVAELDHWEAVSRVDEEFGTVTFEARLRDPPVISAVTARGGYVASAAIEDGDYHMTLHLPNVAEVRGVTDAVEAAYPGVEVVTRRQVAGGDTAARRLRRALADDLTDRQRATLEAAYFAGYFEWPRETDGQSVADSLGVSDSTFHQHVRKAQNKLLDALLAEPSPPTR